MLGLVVFPQADGWLAMSSAWQHARSLALGRYAFNAARDYALRRDSNGRPALRVSGPAMENSPIWRSTLDSAQLLPLTRRDNADRRPAVGLRNRDWKAACNLARLRSASEAVQIMGALGYSQEDAGRYCMRRTRGWMIAAARSRC